MKFKLLFSLLALSLVSKSQSFNLLWTKDDNITVNDDRARDNAVDSSGLYIVGNDYQPGNNQWRIEKRDLYTGKLIWARTANPSGGNDYPQDIVVFKSALYISGYENISGTDYRWRLEKRDPTTGALIWVQKSNPSPGGDVGFGLCANDSGVFMVGADYAQGKNQWRMERHDLISGNLIWAQVTNPATTGTSAQAYSVVADDSAIYVCGYDNAPNTGEWHIEKRSISNGALIWTKLNDFSTLGADYAMDIVMDSSGIYIAGSDYEQGTTDCEWRIQKRNLQTGDTIWTQRSNPSSFNESAFAITKDSNFIYVGGTEALNSSNLLWRIEKRSLIDGSLLCVATSNPSPTNFNSLMGISVDQSGVYASGQAELNGSYEWRMEKHNLCVNDSLPIAAFTSSAGELCQNGCISFSDSSYNNPKQWAWTFQGTTPNSIAYQQPDTFCYANAGIFTVTLYVANGAGLDSITKAITVHSLPNVSVTINPDTVCINSSPVLLSGGLPAGGIYSGNGISAAIFDAQSAGNGMHELLYFYTDSNGCSNADSTQIYVDLCTGIKKIFHSELNLYPNPFKEKTNLLVSANMLGATLILYNSFGFEVFKMEQITAQEFELKRNKLPCGIYFLRILKENKIAASVKLVIQD